MSADSTASVPLRRLGVLISGRGSNLQAIIDAVAGCALDATIAIVVSNRPEAAGLSRAQEAGIPAVCMRPREYATAEAYEQAVVDLLRSHDVSLVCLAGFMRIVGRTLLDAYAGHMLNIHPSLLPSFPGLDAQQQALTHGVRISGATVHLVTSELDGGPIVLQAPVPVVAEDSVETLSARILLEEHRIYPEAIRLVLAGGWRLDGRRFIPA